MESSIDCRLHLLLPVTWMCKIQRLILSYMLQKLGKAVPFRRVWRNLESSSARSLIWPTANRHRQDRLRTGGIPVVEVSWTFDSRFRKHPQVAVFVKFSAFSCVVPAILYSCEDIPIWASGRNASQVSIYCSSNGPTCYLTPAENPGSRYLHQHL